jgi:hypothetical protein
MYVKNLLNTKPKITPQFQGRKEFHTHTPLLLTTENAYPCPSVAKLDPMFPGITVFTQRQGEVFSLYLALKYVKYVKEAALINRTTANRVTNKRTMWRQTKACITKSYANRRRTEHD